MKFIALVALIALMSLASAQTTVPVIGQVEPYLTAAIKWNPNLQLNNGPMIPGNCYSTGNIIEVRTNAPFDIVTSTNPTGGFMASVANQNIKLHAPMTCMLDTTNIFFDLDSPQTMHFSGPSWVGKTSYVSITLGQCVSILDRALGSGDHYELQVTFTLSN